MNGQERYEQEKLRNWLFADSRFETFRAAASFINYELVEGDILEFGVGVGKSLALWALSYQRDVEHMAYENEIIQDRRIIGFDSFEGLPEFQESHPRWQKGTFGRNYELYHPWLSWQDDFDENAALSLFSRLDLKPPHLVKGWFTDTLLREYPKSFRKVAVLHLDCDLYQPALEILLALESAMQEGTIVLMDDYFCYKGNPNKGEARAFREFLDKSEKWSAQHYRSYGTFCNSFILYPK